MRVTNLETNVTRVAPAMAEFFGLESEFIQDFNSIWVKRVHPADRDGFEQDIRATMRGLQDYHFKNLEDSFDLKIEEVEKNHKARIAASSCVQVIEEMLINESHQNAKGTGRLIIHKEDGTVTGVAF